MPTLYIASDSPGSGRTALAAGIAALLHHEGIPSFLLKPLFLSEEEGAADPNADDYRRLGLPLAAEPVAVAPQDLEEGLGQPLRRSLEQAFGSIHAGEGVTIAEGLPGIDAASPLGRASAELAALLDATVMVVVRFTPGLVAGSLTGARDLFGNRLLGVVINGVSRYRGRWTQASLIPSVTAESIRVLGAIPEDRSLLAVRVGDIAQAMEGEFLQGAEKADELVDHLMLGANVLDESTLYFQQRERKAVLVRGDRPDIQMGALSTDTACLVLTAGKDTIQYVRYEAALAAVPLIRVAQPTLQAARLLEGLLEQARFDHPRKLERLQELLAQHLDWQAIRDGLGV